jgi:hypothetical protein
MTTGVGPDDSSRAGGVAEKRGGEQGEHGALVPFARALRFRALAAPIHAGQL